ncbi:FecR family protein [Breznakiella homolactica]|uniref:FecR family protein n=1 Tax=Breznakiella homolactica TaxID=2798577 RepID=A0A7T7XL66_9SPIR|nr:FecR family protein [Breznakiella homolactica]QQO08424.1 FecR family protein [Breznakiella homolactica]
MRSKTGESKRPRPEQKNTSPLLPKILGPADFVYIGFCIAALLGVSFLFWNDLNQTLTRLSEQPVGIVTYKYRAAQRRFVDRVLWDRPKQGSPVYNGDYIRTAELSQTTVTMNAGGIITLEENTLVQIWSEIGKLWIDLAGGTLSADARSGALSIKSGGTVVEADSGSMVQTAASAEGLDVIVLEGTAQIQDKNERITAGAGEFYSSNSGDASRGTARVAALSPRPAAKFLNTTGDPLSITFRWNRIGFASQETVTLDIAEDRNFTRIVAGMESSSDEARVPLADGMYYWRAYPSSEAGGKIRQGGVSGRFAVIHALPPRLAEPQPGAVYRFAASSPGIRFLWTACEGAMAYLVEAADNPGMADAVFRSQVQAVGGETESVVHSGLEAGTYYWRVTPVYARDYEGTPIASAVSNFRIEKTAALSVPETRAGQGAVYLDGRSEKTYFTWEQEDEAVSYTFLLSQQEDLSRPVVRETVRDNYYAFDIKAADLDSGQYYWGVYQTDIAGNSSVTSEARVLVVHAGAPPERSPAPAAAVIPAAAEKPAAAEPEVLPTRPAAVTVQPAAPPAAAEKPPARPSAPVTPPPAAPPAPSETVPATAAQPAAKPPEPVKLPRPGSLRPAAGYVLTEEIIIRDNRMVFSWEPVSGAASYIFSISQGGQEIIRQTVQSASFTLPGFRGLDEGTVTWRVQAIPADQNRFLPSDVSESRFTVELDDVQAAEGVQGGLMFGKE